MRQYAGDGGLAAKENGIDRMTTSGTGTSEARAAIDRLLGELRPKLHR